MRKTPRHPGAQLLVSLGCAAAAARCSDGFEPDAPLECAGDQTVAVAVQPSVRPTFTWEPGCGMASISVESPDGATWVVYTVGGDAGDNPIGSGVRYGDAPPGTAAPTPAAPLQSGVEYTVTVYRWIGEPGGPGSLFARGSAEFVR